MNAWDALFICKDQSKHRDKLMNELVDFDTEIFSASGRRGYFIIRQSRFSIPCDRHFIL